MNEELARLAAPLGYSGIRGDTEKRRLNGGKWLDATVEDASPCLRVLFTVEHCPSPAFPDSLAARLSENIAALESVVMIDLGVMRL